MNIGKVFGPSLFIRSGVSCYNEFKEMMIWKTY